MSINYITGDATEPEGFGVKIIVHCCNDIGVWGAGFVKALSAKWEEPERQYKRWAKDGYKYKGQLNRLELGDVQYVEVAHTKRHKLIIANLIGQHETGGQAVRYDAIDKGLKNVAKVASGSFASVHMPRMGAGLAGGDWRVIEALINVNLIDEGVAVNVYDLPELPAIKPGPIA